MRGLEPRVREQIGYHVEGDLGRVMAMAEKADVWRSRGEGQNSKGQNKQKAESLGSSGQGQMSKGNKKPVCRKKGSGMQSREKGLYLLKEHIVLGPLLRLHWGQTPKGIKIKISRKWDQSKNFHTRDAEASINLRIVHSGRMCRPCLLRRKSRETERPVLSTHMVWQPGSRTMLGKC